MEFDYWLLAKGIVMNGCSGCVAVFFGALDARLFLGAIAAVLLIGAPSAAAEAVADSKLAVDSQVAIRSAAEYDYPPFSVMHREESPQDQPSENEEATGFSVDLLRAALGSMGRAVSFEIGTWAEVKASLEQGKIEVLPLVGRTPEREALFDFTFPYMSLHGAIVVREDTKDIRELSDLKGRDVVVMQGDNAEEFLRRIKLDARIHTTKTFEDALLQLSKGSYDAVVIQRLLALRLIQHANISNLQIINKPLTELRQDFCFAVKEGDSALLSVLNEGLAQVIADGTFNRLRSKWFASLDLPSAERIVVGGDYNYPPYEFLDKKGQPTGYNIELTQALARVTGLDIEIRLGPWADIVEQMKSGEIDVIQGMFYSPERDKLFEFSPPHTVIHHVAVVRKNTLPPAQIADLMGKRIVVMKGDIMHDWLLEKGINTQITTVETQADALRELASGKHDCALVARLPAMYLIEKYGLDNLILAEHSLLAPEYGYAVPHQRKVLLARLSEGLNILHRSGEYQRIYVKWMGVYESSTPDVFTILRYVAMVVMPLLLILLAMLIWSRMLRKEVALRTQALIEANQIIDRSPAVAFLWKSVEGWPVEFVSANVEKLTGYTTGDFVEAKVAYSEIIHPDDLKRVAAEVIDYCKEGSLLSFAHEPYRIITQSGATKWVDDKSYIRRDAENCITHLEGIVQDITEDINRQAQLIQSQKMESVGRLAGGVAHDFNNMLAVIIGNVAMALEEVSPKSPPYEELEEIRKAAERSADLIRQLLAFARKQIIAPRVLQLNKTVDGMLKMLRRLIGEDIDLVWQPGADIWSVRVDPSQVDQVLANFCVNARDAIKGVGKVTIKTENSTVDEVTCSRYPGLVPGDYVLLRVSDNGCGIKKEYLDKIFEPFFTTKDVNEGSGLGLSTVYGIVKQNGGFIYVESEVGVGTTFRLYLHKDDSLAEEEQVSAKAGPALTYNETILLVEDEEAILSLVQRILQRYGYTVLAASTPSEAIQLAKQSTQPVHLLITDVIMPDMSGRDLAKELLTTWPQLKCLFMSGYTADMIAHHGVLDSDLHFIEKPFLKEDLNAKVREVLDGHSEGQTSS